MLSYRRSIVTAILLLALYLVFNHVQPSQLHSSLVSEKAYSHWSSRSNKPSQRPINAISQKPLREQLEYHFPYRQLSKFPAYIWQTWRVGPSSKKFPEAWKKLEASWTEKNPGFIHEVIADDAALPFLRHLYSALPTIIDAYRSLPHAVLRADFFRYLVLLARGGLYSDMDTFNLKPVTAWVPPDIPRDSYGLVIGIEADPDRDDWEKWYSRRIQFCQWTIQAKAGHPILREIVAQVTEKTLDLKKRGKLVRFDLKNTVNLTGPSAWTDVIFDYLNDPAYFAIDDNPSSAGADGSQNATQNVTWRNFTGIKTQHKVGDIVVLPITSFSPGVGQMGAGPDNDTMAFVKHFFEGTWKTGRDRSIGKNGWQNVIRN